MRMYDRWRTPGLAPMPSMRGASELGFPSERISWHIAPFAALAVPGNPRCEDQGDGRSYKRAWDERVGPRHRAGQPAPGMSRERFLRLLDVAEG
jgi:hypothetical protein